jgi:hypothetical protein
MEVWKVVNAYGENYPTVIYVVRVSQIFGNPIIAYLKKPIQR